MECKPISETHIQNNTCVLAPEVTEGPYYHIEGHPVRRNIAEYQDGLLLVSYFSSSFVKYADKNLAAGYRRHRC